MAGPFVKSWSHYMDSLHVNIWFHLINRTWTASTEEKICITALQRFWHVPGYASQSTLIQLPWSKRRSGLPTRSVSDSKVNHAIHTLERLARNSKLSGDNADILELDSETAWKGPYRNMTSRWRVLLCDSQVKDWHIDFIVQCGLWTWWWILSSSEGREAALSADDDEDRLEELTEIWPPWPQIFQFVGRLWSQKLALTNDAVFPLRELNGGFPWSNGASVFSIGILLQGILQCILLAYHLHFFRNREILWVRTI